MIRPSSQRSARSRAQLQNSDQPLQVESLSIFDLFGKLDYPFIPISDLNHSKRVSVLYGDNGTGKTTILKLIYACLSWQSNMGLRSLLATTPFTEFSIKLSDGTSVQIKKPALIGGYKFCVVKGEDSQEFEVVTDADGEVRDQKIVDQIEIILRGLGFEILFVDHNRIIQSNYSFLADRFGSQEAVQAKINRNELEYVVFNRLGKAERLVKDKDMQFPLLKIVDAVNRWVSSQAYRQGAAGDQNAAAVYLEIAKSLAKDRRRKAAASIVSDVEETLIYLKGESESFTRHGLLSEYPFDQFYYIYTNASKAKRAQIETVISPFLDSIQRRINALADVNSMITKFESEISKYLKSKSVFFCVPDGLRISDENGTIDLDSLSSGEKQLIFLLCSAVMARSKRGIILIDEPELSLNYKWQRLIAGSLSNLSMGGGTQYVLASHSIEIITRYVDSSYELVG